MKKLNLGNINAGLNSLKAATDNAAQNGRFELIDTALIDFAAKNSYAADDNEESYKELAANQPHKDECQCLNHKRRQWV